VNRTLASKLLQYNTVKNLCRWSSSDKVLLNH